MAKQHEKYKKKSKNQKENSQAALVLASIHLQAEI